MQKTFEKRLSSKEAAQRIGVTPSTIVRWVRSGKLQGFLVGKVLTIPLEAIEDCLSRIRERWS